MTGAELEAYILQQEREEWERERKRAEIKEKIDAHEKILSQAEAELSQAQSVFSDASGTALRLFQQYERNRACSDGNIAKEYDRVHSVCEKNMEEINGNVSQMMGAAESSIAYLQLVIDELWAEYFSI